MTPIAWALLPLKRYADFEGRSPRAEYWWFCLFQWLGYIALFIVFIAVIAAAASSSAHSG